MVEEIVHHVEVFLYPQNSQEILAYNCSSSSGLTNSYNAMPNVVSSTIS